MIDELIAMGCQIIPYNWDGRVECSNCKFLPTYRQIKLCYAGQLPERELKINCIHFQSKVIESENEERFWE